MAANNPACRHQPCPCCSSAPAGTGRPLAAPVRTGGGLIDSSPASRHMEPNGCRIPHPEAEGISGDGAVPAAGSGTKHHFPHRILNLYIP